jgi:GNAT superfamily N-acetyltransferase
MTIKSSVATIREATEQDALQLKPLLEQLGYPSSEDDISDRLRELLDDQSQTVLVAQSVAGDLLGFVQVGYRPLLVTNRVAEIAGLVVLDTIRGSGVGRLLMTAAEEWARRNNCTEVTLRSNIVREESHKFYLHVGYSEYKRSLAFKKSI